MGQLSVRDSISIIIPTSHCPSLGIYRGVHSHLEGMARLGKAMVDHYHPVPDFSGWTE